MGKETPSNAQDARKRRLLRPVLPFHPRASRHHQGRGEAFGEHHRLRPRADRRLPHDVRAPANSGGCFGSRHEEPENFHTPRIRSTSTRAQVPDAPRGTSSEFKDGQALTVQSEQQGLCPRISALVRFQLLRRPAQRFVLSLLLCVTAPASAADYPLLLEPDGTTLLARISHSSNLIAALSFAGALVVSLFILERPTRLSPRSYLAELSRRVTEEQFPLPRRSAATSRRSRACPSPYVPLIDSRRAIFSNAPPEHSPLLWCSSPNRLTRTWAKTSSDRKSTRLN